MAKSRRGKKRQGQLRPVPLHVWMEIAGILMMGAAVVTVLSLMSWSRGMLTNNWLRLLRQAFGWGAYVLPIGLGAVGLWLFLLGFGRLVSVSLETVAGTLFLFLGSLGLLHFVSTEPQALAQAGGGGGHLGWLISRTLIGALGDLGALLVLLTVLAVGMIALFSISVVDVARRSAALWRRLVEWRRSRSEGIEPAAPPRADGAAPPPTDDSLAALLMARVQDASTRRRPAAKPLVPGQGPLVPRVVGGATSVPTLVPASGPGQTSQGTAQAREWRLPACDEILEKGVDQELSQAEIRARVRIIEETLANFGVPAKVVEVNQGPTVTQFGVEPGFVERKDALGKTRRVKVKVNRISTLSNDLSLALAASPIRIEAPVPGRAIVGIEVPNVSTSLVSLRSVVDSDPFRKLDSKLRIALGQDVAGQPVAADLAQMPHLLIAGATGSGKSVCINAITACLLLNNTPADLRLIMVDPKMVELATFNGIPHLLVPVVIEVERVVATLKWVTHEMDRRYRVFSKLGARNIDVYNHIMTGQGQESLPCIVVLIDELADLMMVAPDDVERSICRIAQLARATGIHLVIATQRPSVDVVTGLIKANFPARISFAVTSQVDSRVILDTGGAEKLLGRGDMLYMASDSSKMLRLQGCFISDAELSKLVSYWRGFSANAPLPPGTALVQQPLWQEVIAKEREAAGRDDLLDRAMEVVHKDRRASISLLQRKLRIGYSRAARLIDTLEEKGIVGPEEGAGRGRQVYDETPPGGGKEEAPEGGSQ
jgi:S-DNA-T family DNA segregation ATPase FtsK/SpoIIIE